jgi:hypothetical protein
MTPTILEKDWKYLSRVQPEMLSALCGRINRKAMEILGSDKTSEHEKYLALYRYLQDADRIVGDCFNDWRRSTIWLTVGILRRHGLLTEEHVQHLTDETQDLLKTFSQLGKER